MIKFIVTLSCLLLSFSSFAEIDSPPWFKQDIARKAKWLPGSIKSQGLDQAYRNRLSTLPYHVVSTLEGQNIPGWMIALIPSSQNIQDEIHKQLSNINYLNGSGPQSSLARRAEQLLVFAGAAQLPTPGDKATGQSLGPEGCTAAIAKYILSQLKMEYPDRLAGLPMSLATTQSSVEMKSLFSGLARSGATWFDMKTVPFSQLRASHVKPGSIMIAQKPGGTHVFAWTRVLGFWNWSPSAKMAIGNTGLKQFGSRMILAQEYISDDFQENEGGTNVHNEHGPINSSLVVKDRSGYPVLSDPRTNVYAAQGSSFVLINLH